MKRKIFSLIALGIAFSAASFAQTVRASIGEGSQNNRIKIFLKTDVTQTSTISTLQFNVGVDATGITTAPNLAVTSNGLGIANTGWTVGTPYLEGGYWNYNIYTSTSPLSANFTANADFEAMEVEFSNGVPATGRVGLVTLPDGGSSTFAALFYCTGTVNSNGLSDLYYSRTGVTVDNQNSYDPSGSTSGTGTSVASIPSVVLPVRFLNFTATKNNNTAVLNWAVESEDANTAFYDVEKSVNGTDFVKISTLQALNNGRSSNTYNFNVENLASIRNNGVIYFRIKQFDKNGVSINSEIRSVRLNSKGLTVGVYPNPVKTTANVSFDLENNAEVAVSLMDANGKQIFVKQLQGIKGINITSINMSNLAAGSYSLKVIAGTDVKIIPVVKGNY